MAQTRTYDPDEGDDLAKLVRQALGETVRPPEPGGERLEISQEDAEDDSSVSLIDLPDVRL